MRKRGNIQKRGNAYSVIVYLGKDPATGKEKRKRCTFPTLREAERFVHQFYAHGGAVAPPNTRVRLGEFLEQWLRDYATSAVSPTTLRCYQGIVKHIALSFLGLTPLPRLAPQAIQSFLAKKLEEGLSSTTVRHIYALLHGALGHAVKWGLIPRNPCDFVDPPRRRQAEMRVWDEEQVRLFLAEARRSSRYYVLYLAAILTGMRQGELLGLRWQDVDLTLGIASVRQTFYPLYGSKQRSKQVQLLFKEPKSAKSRRTIALPPTLVEELHKVREEQARYREAFGSAYADYGLVFCQPNGKPLNANNIVKRDFRRVIERAGLPRIRFHDLRHCHATHLLRQGVHPKVVQERLGHATTAFTLAVYSHVLPGMQEEAARRIENTLLGTSKDRDPFAE